MMAISEEEDGGASMSANVRRMEKGFHEFKLEKYSLCKGVGVKNPVSSKVFAVGGYRWMVCFFPDGVNEAAHKAGYASVYLCLLSECSKPVRCLVELKIVDQSGGGNHVGPSCFRSDNGGPAARFLGDVLPCFSKRGVIWGVPDTIKCAALDEPSSRYLKDDCLVIHCTVGVLSSHIQNLPVIEKEKVSSIRMDLERLLETKQGADVVFRVDGQNFGAHKWILAARSPVFRSLIINATQEEIVIPEIEPKIFQAVLRFIYCGNLHEDEEEETFFASNKKIFKSFLGKILAAADQFELKALRKNCESKILAKLSVESVAYLLHLAELHHAADLKASCLEFTAKNQSAVLESEGSEYLKEACPTLFLELAGFQDNKQSKELEHLGEIFTVVKESLVAAFSTWDMWQKIKEF